MGCCVQGRSCVVDLIKSLQSRPSFFDWESILSPKKNARTPKKSCWQQYFSQGRSNHQSLHESTVSPTHPRLPHVVLEGKGHQSPHSPRRSVSRKGCVNQISRCRNVDLRVFNVFVWRKLKSYRKQLWTIFRRQSEKSPSPSFFAPPAAKSQAMNFRWFILLMAEILHQLRLVVYPIIYRVSAPSQVVGNEISAINSINHHPLCKDSKKESKEPVPSKPPWILKEPASEGTFIMGI